MKRAAVVFLALLGYFCLSGMAGAEDYAKNNPLNKAGQEIKIDMGVKETEEILRGYEYEYCYCWSIEYLKNREWRVVKWAWRDHNTGDVFAPAADLEIKFRFDQDRRKYIIRGIVYKFYNQGLVSALTHGPDLMFETGVR